MAEVHLSVPDPLAADLAAICEIEGMPMDVAVTEALQGWMAMGNRKERLDDLKSEVRTTLRDLERGQVNQNPFTGKERRRSQ